MKIALSNLAWETKDDLQILNLLERYNINGIELALSKIWDDPTKVTKQVMQHYRKFWNSHNIQIVATTSLLFGRPELTIFESETARDSAFRYLIKIAQVTNLLGGKVMMFGSPKNRIKGNLPEKKVTDIATDFFGRLADAIAEYGINFVIEPNPYIYGGDYITTAYEAVELVKILKRRNFGINLDSGEIAVNKFDYGQLVTDVVKFALHAHISEPFLKNIPSGKVDHRAYSSALKKSGYSNWLSIEMPLQSTDLNQVEKTLQFVTSYYK